MEEEIQIPVERADKRYFSIGKKRTGDMNAKNVPHAAAVEPRGLISDVVMHDAALHIYLRSIVQVCAVSYTKSFNMFANNYFGNQPNSSLNDF